MLGDLPRGTQLHGNPDGPAYKPLLPLPAFPGPFSMGSSRPGTLIHPAVSLASAGFAMSIPTRSWLHHRQELCVICFLLIDSARQDAGHGVRV